MMSESLLAAENDLRRAVARQMFSSVDALVAAYCSLAEAEATAFPAEHPDHRRILTRAQEVLEWARLMIGSARAVCAYELNRLPMVSAYLEPKPRDPAGVHLDF